MGHQGCGAVTAAVQNRDLDGPATHSHVDSLIAAIRPAVLMATQNGGELLDQSIRENARLVSQQIASAPPIMARLGELGVQVVPAYCALSTGEINWI